MKSRKKSSSSGVKETSRGTSGETSPKNKKPHKIDWAYLSYLKARGQIPVVRFTVTVELPKRDSKRKTGEYLSLAEACKIIGISLRKRLSLFYIPTENRCDKIVVE